MFERNIFSFEYEGKTYYYESYSEYLVDNIVKKDGKFYYRTKCHKCEGHGRIAIFLHRHAGVCYDCMGSGIREVRIYPTVNKSTIENRIAKKKANQEEARLAYNLRNMLNRFGEDFYIIANTKEHNTYNEKEMLKSEYHCKWESYLGYWISQVEVPNFINIKFHTRDYLTNDNIIKYDVIKAEIEDKLKELGGE